MIEGGRGRRLGRLLQILGGYKCCNDMDFILVNIVPSEFLGTNIESWRPRKGLMYSLVSADPWLVNQVTGFYDLFYIVLELCVEIYFLMRLIAYLFIKMT